MCSISSLASLKKKAHFVHVKLDYKKNVGSFNKEFNIHGYARDKFEESAKIFLLFINKIYIKSILLLGWDENGFIMDSWI